ncbi:hypothetical protein HY643_02085 [Candidatus Woesearchaeota archaeon]|nr:hypothetical protein [Candidatus Woesearchaeota archaeon]
MKKEVTSLIFFLIIILNGALLSALKVDLSSPTDGTTFLISNTNVTFSCTAKNTTAFEYINNITLYINFPSGWLAQNYTSTTEQGIRELTFQHNFINITNNTYSWNCLATGYNNETFYNDSTDDLQYTKSFSAANFSFTLIPPPTYTTMPSMEWLEDTINSSLNLSVYFDDPLGGDNLTYVASSAAYLAININSNKIVNITPSANWYGSEYIYFNATYNGATTKSNAINITIFGINDAPTFSGTIRNLTWNANTNESSLDLESYFHDVDNAKLNYSYTPIFDITVLIDDDGDVKFVPNIDFIGTASIVFYANDSINSTKSNNITLTVKEAALANNPPNITSYSQPPDTLPLDVGQSLTLTITKSDPDGDLTTVQWYVDNAPISGATANSYTYTASLGIHLITVNVSDGSLTTSSSWNIISAEAAPTTSPNVTTPPQITTQPKAECGDGIIQENEDCESCASDVKCEKGENCKKGVCVKEGFLTNFIIMIILVIIVLVGVVGGVIYFLKVRSRKEEAKPRPTIQTQPQIVQQTIKPATTTSVGGFVERPQQPIQPAQQQKPMSPVAAYIQKMREFGHTEEEIKAKLRAKGWSEEQIEKALKEA